MSLVQFIALLRTGFLLMKNGYAEMVLFCICGINGLLKNDSS